MRGMPTSHVACDTACYRWHTLPNPDEACMRQTCWQAFHACIRTLDRLAFNAGAGTTSCLAVA